MKKLIIVEGPGGVGKTTYIKEYVKNFEEYSLLKFPLDTDPEVYSMEQIEEYKRYMFQSDSEEWRYKIALDMIHEQITTIKEQADEVVICDRGILSTLIYQQVPHVCEEFLLKAFFGNFPDTAISFIVLDAPSEVIMNRKIARMTAAGKAPTWAELNKLSSNLEWQRKDFARLVEATCLSYKNVSSKIIKQKA